MKASRDSEGRATTPQEREEEAERLRTEAENYRRQQRRTGSGGRHGGRRRRMSDRLLLAALGLAALYVVLRWLVTGEPPLLWLVW